MSDLTLGSLNLHVGRGARRHDAPLYDVVAAVKEVDTDILVVQEAWVPDGEPGDVALLADALGYEVAASFSQARVTRDGGLRIVARDGTDGRADWMTAVLSRLPVVEADVLPLGPQLPRDPARRALVRATVDVDGRWCTVAGTHLPLLKDPVWRLAPALRRALSPADQPAVLAGDMNMWGWCIDRLVPPGWRRTVRGRTFPAHRPHSQIDHILVTPPVTVVESAVIPQVMSDHRPIRATLRL